MAKVSEEKIIKKLTAFGITAAEAGVYYAMLALSGASVEKIARRANVNRSSCYPIVQRLVKLGIASKVKRKGATVYVAAKPEKFLELLEEKKESIEEIIPDLNGLFERISQKPVVTMFEGSEGLKTVLSSILEEADEIMVFGDGDGFREAIPGWSDYYISRRVSKKIKVRMVMKGSARVIEAAKSLRKKENDESRLVKIRVLPEAYEFNHCGFDVFGDKTILYSFAVQNVAVVIESKIISNMMKNIFELLWNDAEKYDSTLLKN